MDSWAALWDPRFKGRVLMLDDPRETLGAALKWQGQSLNTTRRGGAAQRPSACSCEQRPLVKTYDSANYHDVLLSGDVVVAQGWNGQFAKVMDQDPDLDYVVPKEGSSLFIDCLVIPAEAPHQELAHAFLDFIDGAGDRGRDLPDHGLLHARTGRRCRSCPTRSAGTTRSSRATRRSPGSS